VEVLDRVSIQSEVKELEDVRSSGAQKAGAPRQVTVAFMLHYDTHTPRLTLIWALATAHEQVRK